MKIGAGIAGILLGIFSLLYVGLFGGMIGSAAGRLGSLGTGNSTISNWASVVSLLSWLAPLLAIMGGIVTFSNPRAGGVLLASSAGLLWYLLGFGMIGNLFVLPIGAAALLAFFAAPSTSTATLLGATTAASGQSNSVPNDTVARFDRAKWSALVQYDKDIALMAEKLRPLGQKWLDEFASSYLVLNDKRYLPDIEQKITAAAKFEAEESERLKEQWRAREEEQQRVRFQEQARLAEERRKQLELWRDRIWGSKHKRMLTTSITSLIVLTLVLIAVWPKRYSDALSYCNAVIDREYADSSYVGAKNPPAAVAQVAAILGDQNAQNLAATNQIEWSCMNGHLFECWGGQGCRNKLDTSTIPSDQMKEYCLAHPNPPQRGMIPKSVHGNENSAGAWICNGTTPVAQFFVRVNKFGYPDGWWHDVATPDPMLINH